ncbi:zinc finger protein Xfin [Drosophila mauritiana]|uniref:Zinc finger protein Xfin n=1 Tax=Drosophila mauritiana TaxID=7226 RepID=A0A6P8JJZ0_DROMA|nr:zinc finger protein Xfin [Drosophila mauritiana]
MVVCGNILARNNFEHFVLACAHQNDCYVEMELKRWREFIVHVKEHLEANPSLQQELNASEVISSAECEEEVLPAKVFIVEEPPENCLAEDMFVDVPPSSENDESTSPAEEEEDEEEDDDVDSSSMTVDSELGTRNSTNFAPLTKFNPTFYRRSPRITQFIELYKQQTSLWDPADESYRDKEKRAAAYEELLDQLKTTANLNLTAYKLKKCITSLHAQYAAISRQKKTQKLTKVPLYYHGKYSFLAQRGSLEDADSDDDDGDGKIKLVFTEENQLTTQFIDLYSKFPQLYDPAHEHFCNLNVRKSSLIEITDLLTSKFSLGLVTHYDVYDSIQSMRQWYSRRIKTLTDVQSVGLSLAEKQYIERCNSFMPTKSFRQKLKCEVCEHSFSTDHALQAHQFRDHQMGEGGWFRCTLCELNFDRKCHLQQHSQRVHMDKSFVCDICSRSFAFGNQLAIHKRTHDEKHIAKPFVCEFCGKCFKQKIQMTTHVTAVHTKIRAFKCDMCPKDFLTKRDLKDHIKAHLNIRDKVCEVCQKAFTNANALVKHRHIHKEKTLQCSLCTTRFSERVSLGVHMRRTHKILKSSLSSSDALFTNTFPQP